MKATVSESTAQDKVQALFKTGEAAKSVGIRGEEREGMIKDFVPVIKYMALRLAMPSASSIPHEK